MLRRQKQSLEGTSRSFEISGFRQNRVGIRAIFLVISPEVTFIAYVTYYGYAHSFFMSRYMEERYIEFLGSPRPVFLNKISDETDDAS